MMLCRSSMIHCASVGIPPPLHADLMLTFVCVEGRDTTAMHVIRMFEYIEGDTVYKVGITDDLLYQGGKLLSKFCSAVQVCCVSSSLKRRKLSSLGNRHWAHRTRATPHIQAHQKPGYSLNQKGRDASFDCV